MVNQIRLSCGYKLLWYFSDTRNDGCKGILSYIIRSSLKIKNQLIEPLIDSRIVRTYYVRTENVQAHIIT